MITSWNEIPVTRTAELDEKNRRTYQRQFALESTVDNELEAVVLQYVIDNIVGLGGVMPGDSLAFCRGLSLAQVEDGYRWTCTADFGFIEAEDEELNPLEQPAEFDWSFQTETIPIDYDQDGYRIQNSCGDPPATAIEVPTYRAVLKISRNEATFDPELAWQYAGAVNADNFQGAAPGTVQFVPPRAKRQRDQTYGFYWSVEYEFIFNPDRFVPYRLLDQGYRELNDDDEPVYILDNEGEKVSDPVLLKDGKRLESGEPPVFLEFDHLPQLPFSIFNF